ncbi:MAG: AhpC/TSA family protein [Odoribacteraceae bacterium]|jgi:peroxiredoxin|nr:AhpC/TSA family protein [Odoribacteraceae bacterium]
MKKLLLATGILPLLLLACGEKPNILVNGEIKEGAGTTVYLERIDPDGSRLVDSARVNASGKFSIATRDTLPPVFYSLRFSNGERVTLVAAPGDTLTVTGTLNGIHDNYWVEGSDDALWIKLLDFQMSRTVARVDSLGRLRDSIPAGPAFDARRATVEAAFRETLEKQLTFTRDFILDHAISPAAYYALYQRITPDLVVMDEVADYQSFKIVASSMSALYPGSPYTVSLLNHLKTIAARLRDQQLRELIDNAEGSLPPARLPDVKGKIIDLAEMKARLVILDFTLLTARESLEHVKEMQRVHEKYRSRGVAIYQVCLDPNRLAWEEMVERLGITWTCVRDENALQSRVAAAWNVKEIPANYIINDKKEIVGKNLHGTRLDERVAELLAR